jgi:hypothetical protein
MRQYSFGWWGVLGMVIHTAAGSPAFRKNAATVPPPIPIGLAFIPVTVSMALVKDLTTGASAGVGVAASCR